ncbi:MAG: DUF1854 domain-containing protein [Spirochaetaceae bacterium]|nr:DUF1854 domain-containing protein [Spirochaetaceae bacterium]
MNGNDDADRAGGARLPRLGPDRVRFERTGGYLVRAVLADGTSHEPVDFYRAFPYSSPDDLVVLRDSRGAELGILAPLAQFLAAERKLVEEELQRRYFAPRIVTVDALDERFGQSHWRVTTDAGPTRFTVQNEHANLRDLADGSLLLIDVDGNRYRLAPRAELEPRIRRKLEAMF